MTDQKQKPVNVTALSAIYKRKFNLGDYNGLEIESAIWTQPDPSDDPQAVLDVMWKIVKRNVKTQAMPVVKRYMLTNEDGEDIPYAATTTATLNGQPLAADAAGPGPGPGPAPANPQPAAKPAPQQAQAAQQPGPQPQNQPGPAPTGQIETIKIDSFSIAYTKSGGKPFIQIKGGKYSTHGIPLYDNMMSDEFLQAWPEWNTWTPQKVVTEIPAFMEFCYYDPQEKKIVGLAGRN